MHVDDNSFIKKKNTLRCPNYKNVKILTAYNIMYIEDK